MPHNDNIIRPPRWRESVDKHPGDKCDCHRCDLIREIGITLLEYIHAAQTAPGVGNRGVAIDEVLTGYIERINIEVITPTVYAYREEIAELMAKLAKTDRQLKRSQLIGPIAIAKIEAYREEIIRLGGDPARVGKMGRRKPGGKSSPSKKSGQRRKPEPKPAA